MNFVNCNTVWYNDIDTYANVYVMSLERFLGKLPSYLLSGFSHCI